MGSQPRSSRSGSAKRAPQLVVGADRHPAVGQAHGRRNLPVRRYPVVRRSASEERRSRPGRSRRFRPSPRYEPCSKTTRPASRTPCAVWTAEFAGELDADPGPEEWPRAGGELAPRPGRSPTAPRRRSARNAVLSLGRASPDAPPDGRPGPRWTGTRRASSAWRRATEAGVERAAVDAEAVGQDASSVAVAVEDDRPAAVPRDRRRRAVDRDAGDLGAVAPAGRRHGEGDRRGDRRRRAIPAMPPP